MNIEIKCLFFLIFIICHTSALFDPISIGIGGAVLGGIYKYKDTLKEKTYCKFYECCLDEYIPNKLYDLEMNMKHKLFGQHLVHDTLLSALREHIKGKSKKPLVISFHGSTGTGKNYVTDMIIKSLYKEGGQSKFVHKFGVKDFSNVLHVDQYKEFIKNKVKQAVSDCEQSLFIFDEVEKMPLGIFNNLVTYLEHHESIDRVNYRRAIFIFLSNSVGLEIGENLVTLMKKGKNREDIQLYDFEKNILLGAYNLDGGLKKSFLIDSSLIDHYVPFLPLERIHVRKCIQAEFVLQRNRIPTDEEIKTIEEHAITYEDIFSRTGCKRISSKIPIA